MGDPKRISFVLGGWRRSDGAVTVEAALIMPLILAIILTFVFMLQALWIENRLQHTASESVKQLAGMYYPVRLLEQTSAGQTLHQVVDRIDSVKDHIDQTQLWVERFERFVPDMLVQLVKNTLQAGGDLYGQGADTADSVSRRTFLLVLRSISDESLLHSEHVKVSRLRLPYGEGRFVDLELEYRLPLPIPFIRHEFLIRKRAYERAW